MCGRYGTSGPPEELPTSEGPRTRAQKSPDLSRADRRKHHFAAVVHSRLHGVFFHQAGTRRDWWAIWHLRRDWPGEEVSEYLSHTGLCQRSSVRLYAHIDGDGLVTGWLSCRDVKLEDVSHRPPYTAQGRAPSARGPLARSPLTLGRKSWRRVSCPYISRGPQGLPAYHAPPALTPLHHRARVRRA